MTIELNLNKSGSIKRAIRELEAYRKSLQHKTEMFVDRLLEEGIQTARNTAGISGSLGSHMMENRVSYIKELNPSADGCYGLMIGYGDTIEAQWYVSDGSMREGVLNAMMALEFGTAGMALPPQSRFGVTGGQGTNAPYGHIEDTMWWIATALDENGKPTGWKAATAITPTRPMHNAMNSMQEKIVEIAKEVFANG